MSNRNQKRFVYHTTSCGPPRLRKPSSSALMSAEARERTKARMTKEPQICFRTSGWIKPTSVKLTSALLLRYVNPAVSPEMVEVMWWQGAPFTAPWIPICLEAVE
eukprot:EG_transcript_21381